MAGMAALTCSVYGDTADARTKLSGAWQGEAGSSDKWVIDEKPDAVHISHATGTEKPVDFECNNVGKECEIKDGKKGKVSMYFNGPKLIQLETHGSEVVKRRFTVAPDGNTLEVEIIPVVPPGKTETIRLTRAADQTASK
jgi:hypothetical protein